MQAEPEAPTLALSSECKIEHCEACFSHNFCTKCKENLYLHKGRCYPACPEGSAAANGTMECSSPGKAGTVGAVGRVPQIPGERWVRVGSRALSRENLPYDHSLGVSLGLFCPLGLSPKREQVGETPMGYSGPREEM